MQRGSRQYEALLGRSERVTWQRDCYMDLQSNPCGPSKSDRDAHGRQRVIVADVFVLVLLTCDYIGCVHFGCVNIGFVDM